MPDNFLTQGYTMSFTNGGEGGAEQSCFNYRMSLGRTVSQFSYLLVAYLAGVLPVHGVNCRSRVHVHQVVMVIAGHHPGVVELFHG